MSTTNRSDSSEKRDLSTDNSSDHQDGIDVRRSDSISISQQAAFDPETGQVKQSETPAESSLDQFGVDVDTSGRDSKVLEAEASSLLKDDRPNDAVGTSSPDDSSEQADLFPDVANGQRTLNGGSANQCLFGQTISSDSDSDGTDE